MASQLTFLVALFLHGISPFAPQATSAARDATFQVSAAQSWTDTGLDLQSGDVVDISAVSSAPPATEGSTASGAVPCDPKGVTGNVDAKPDRPLPLSPPGALIAGLHPDGSSPQLVGASSQIKIEQASHLFLGMNSSGSPVCQRGFEVKVHVVPAGSVDASTTPQSSSGTAESKSRGEQLKSQLATAAQVFMSGQFGTGKSTSTSATSASTSASTSSSTATATSESSGATSSGAATTDSAAPDPPRVSNAPLDADLRKSLDTLPRRVNDQFQNLGDMVNFVIIGNQKDVQAALEAATWHVADTNNQNAVFNAILQTYDKKDYLAMPMSTLYLFARKQDFGYEMAEPIAMVASRHHFRIWKASFTWKGREAWVGAGTHDIGFAKDKRNNNVTHKIDPAVDGERDNIGSSLQKANKTELLSYYLPPDPVKDAMNATGDGYHSDGRLLVIILNKTP